jgi:hypothetical protein
MEEFIMLREKVPCYGKNVVQGKYLRLLITILITAFIAVVFTVLRSIYSSVKQTYKESGAVNIVP